MRCSSISTQLGREGDKEIDIFSNSMGVSLFYLLAYLIINNYSKIFVTFGQLCGTYVLNSGKKQITRSKWTTRGKS